MNRLRALATAPWYVAGLSLLVLLLALGIVAFVGVVENTRLKDASERAIQYDVAVSAVGDDIRVAVLDLRHHHRNIVFSGPTDAVIAEFDATYTALLQHIDQLDAIGVAELDVPQPEELRALAGVYHDAFRPSIVLFTSDPIAFNAASTTGLGQLDALEGMARQIDDAGEQLTAESLGDVEDAAGRERLLLISLLGGVALIGIVLSLSTARVLHRLQAANVAEAAARTGLAESLQMKTDFIADASHELRTPLTLILGNAEIGLATDDSAARIDALREIRGEATRMNRLVNDLLFLARSDAGSPVFDREYVPVRWLVSRLIKPAEAMVRHHGVGLHIEIDGTGDLVVDPLRIEQAVLILIDNAAKFSPPGEIVHVRTSTTTEWLSIEVDDQGPGIPVVDQQRIFERFYQVDDAAPRQRGGAGLGLAIAKSIVEAHGGMIELESEPGMGTTMRIRLPLAREQ